MAIVLTPPSHPWFAHWSGCSSRLVELIHYFDLLGYGPAEIIFTTGSGTKTSRNAILFNQPGVLIILRYRRVTVGFLVVHC